MHLLSRLSAWTFSAGLALCAGAAEHPPGQNPADHLPPYITQVTWFGERADWSHDGQRLLFLSKTFGDAMELDLQTKRIRDLTAHYHHCGWCWPRYLYLRYRKGLRPEQVSRKEYRSESRL